MMGAGAKIQYDSSWSPNSTTVQYTFEFANPASYVPVWSVSGTSGSHAVIEGDSFYASTRNPASCTSINSCLAGAFNHNGGNTYYNNQGQGTISYLDIQDVAGSAVNSVGNAAWVTSVSSGSNSAFDHITVSNSGTAVLIEQAGATAGLTINGLAITNSRYTQAPSVGTYPGALGCLDVIERGTTSATFSVRNGYMDCSVSARSTNSSYGIWTWRNVEMYRSPNGSYPGRYVGINNGGGVSPTDTFDEYYVYASTYISGSAQDAVRPLMPQFSLINSILWSPKTSVGGTHLQLFTGTIQFLPAAGNIQVKNNVFGSMGVNTVGTATQLTVSMSSSGLLPRNVSQFVTGNVSLCDQWGYSSIGFPYGRWTGSVTTHTIAITIENNTACSAIIGGLTGTGDNTGSEGAIGFEGPATQANMVNTIDSNLFWNSRNLAVPEVCGTDSTNFDSPNQPVLLLTNNAVANTNTTSPAVCNDGNAGNASQWVVTGPQNDVTILNRPPAMVAGHRSPVTFDVDYLIPSGILGSVVGQSAATYWSTQTGWRGAWASSTSYAVGDIVSDMQTGSWDSKVLYWRCVQGHTAGTINRPASGVDPANVILDQAAYWEPAYMQFFRQQVYLGTVFYEGAFPQLTDINGNPEPMHIIGLLNAWLRQGMTAMEPQLWNGCLNGRGCGAIQQTAIQHIPPPAAVN
jgi:hypothetical protein